MRARPALWVALATGCHLHPSNNDGGAINLAAAGDRVFVARGCDGIEVVEAVGGALLAQIEPQGESDSYDDVSFADDIIFALDADDGFLSTFTFAGSLVPLTLDVGVEVGPYSGVSARGSFVAVSGGTSELTLFSYAPDGSMTRVGTLEGHRGHPDVALDPRGGAALISTHFSDEIDGVEFGIVRASLSPLAFTHQVPVPGAGFTDGGGTPASFPLRVAFSDEHAIAAHGGGITAMRTSAGLAVVGSLELPFAAVDVAVAETHAYVVGSSPTPRLVEIDISDGAAPVMTRSLEVTGPGAEPFAVVVVGGRAFVAAGEAGLRIIDL